MGERTPPIGMALALLLCPFVAQAQEQEGAAPSYTPEFSTPMPLYTRGLGNFTWKITTRSAESP